MIFKQYYLGCLSQASYLVGDETTGRAVVVDPRRDVSDYLEDALAQGLSIEAVIETHFHADFLSGHLELAKRTGARICYGEEAEAEFDFDPLAHGQRLVLGEVVLEVRATPGHTPESVSIVIFEHEDEAPFGVLTGDTMFIGDVGRPDLLVGAGLAPKEMAGQLYRSLHGQLLSLPDETGVYPAHGAGSACGKNLSSETSSTIGEQRRTNYALQPMSEDAFVEMITDGQPMMPAYFSFSARRNRELRPLLDDHEVPRTLCFAELVDAEQHGAVVLDAREPESFAAGHLEGSVNVGLGGRFAEYVGSVLSPSDPVVLVCEDREETEARVRLGRIGFDHVLGYLADAGAVLAAHPERVVKSSRLSVGELQQRLDRGEELMVLDVRGPGEVALGAIPGSCHIALASLVERLDEVDRSVPVVVYCASGYRSSIAASIIDRAGHKDVSDVLGGYDAWSAAAAVLA